MIDEVEVDEVRECDVLVVGAGAAGMAAAAVAAHAGLKVLVVEKDSLIGGSSSRSYGAVWIPNTRMSVEAGVADSVEMARDYVRGRAGEFYNDDIVSTFLKLGPEAVEFFHENTNVRLDLDKNGVDYYPDEPGATSGARSLKPRAFNGRRLGKAINKLRGPMATMMFIDREIDGVDYGHYLSALRNPRSFLHSAGQIAAAVAAKIFYGKGTKFKNGHALTAALLSTLLEQNVRIITNAPVLRLRYGGAGDVRGAVIQFKGAGHEIKASRGVILATGGFPHDSARSAREVPFTAQNPLFWTPTPLANTGDGIAMAEKSEGHFDNRMKTGAALVPLIYNVGAEGEISTVPIFASRQSPGFISVLPNGKRFVDESSSYHSFCLGLLAASTSQDDATAFFVCDHRALRRYGIGRIKPFPFSIRRYLQTGELVSGRTVSELALKTGIDPAGLEETVLSFNANAVMGTDPEFHRGNNPYDRSFGDSTRGYVNPNLAPLDHGPFYALRVHVGAINTFPGMSINGHGQVLRKDGSAIDGLYAVGNDAASFTGGDYIGGGITLGPALTFGYAAARHAANRAERKSAGDKAGLSLFSKTEARCAYEALQRTGRWNESNGQAEHSMLLAGG